MNEHSNSMLRIRAAQLHARLEEAAKAHQQLTAERDELRNQLVFAEARAETLDSDAQMHYAHLCKALDERDELRKQLAELKNAVVAHAVERAYASELGASEWEAFLSDEVRTIIETLR